MLQRYRLRLGDGTVLQVDKEGLLGWREDARAVVQVAGTSQWRPLREFLKDEESAARLARALVPPEPRRAPAPPAPEAPPPSLLPSPAFEPSLGEPPVQALAEEPSAPTPPWQAPPEAPAAEAPAIRLKPLEDEPRAAFEEPEVVVEEPQDPYAVPRPLAYDAARVEEEEEEAPRDRLEGPLLQVVTAFGTLLSRLLDPLAPLVREWPSRSGVERAPRTAARRSPRPAREAPRAAAPEPLPPPEPPPFVEPPRPLEEPTVAPSPPVSVLAEDMERSAGEEPRRDELQVIPLKPLDEDERVTMAWRGLSEKVAQLGALLSAGLGAASAWGAGLSGRVQRLRERNRRPKLPVPQAEPAPRSFPSAPARAPVSPPARAPLPAPKPIAELPSIHFAEGYDVPEEGDTFDGEVETWSVLPVAWMWTKRLVLVGGIVTVGVLAALNWETWFPRAAELGQTVFTEIDRQAHSSQRAREREQAFANAVERCPHLAPATIRLVLSTSSDGLLEPPEVFQVAAEAADRGISTLAPTEAAELRGLQRALAAHLRPPQRARLADYDRARANRVVFPFENPHALDLVAQGAQAMPAASRARLQGLLGKAVAAGLGVPPASTGPRPAGKGAPAPR